MPPGGGGTTWASFQGRVRVPIDLQTSIRLVEQLSRLAAEMQNITRRLGATPTQDEGRASGEAALFAFTANETAEWNLSAPRKVRPSLPEPKFLRRLIRNRQLRARFFDGDLFADPAWEMLLDLAAARAEGRRVSVTSLCIASGVPSTTALRWIGILLERGLVVRIRDDQDKRRTIVALTDAGASAMAGFFASVELSAR